MNWTLLSDPDNPQESGRPHIPRARYVHFDHDEGGTLRMYIATQGRGVWRVRIGPEQAPVSSAPPVLLPPHLPACRSRISRLLLPHPLRRHSGACSPEAKRAA